jgi:hypothetical protein
MASNLLIKLHCSPSCAQSKRKEERKTSKRQEGDTEKRIAMAIVGTFFFHILGEMGELIHVASKGLSILGY